MIGWLWAIQREMAVGKMTVALAKVSICGGVR